MLFFEYNKDNFFLLNLIYIFNLICLGIFFVWYVSILGL